MDKPVPFQVQTEAEGVREGLRRASVMCGGGGGVQFGRQPREPERLLRCGSSGYPLASGHINDHSTHMAAQSIRAKWHRCTPHATINPNLVIELLKCLLDSIKPVKKWVLFFFLEVSVALIFFSLPLWWS